MVVEACDGWRAAGDGELELLVWLDRTTLYKRSKAERLLWLKLASSLTKAAAKDSHVMFELLLLDARFRFRECANSQSAIVNETWSAQA